MEIYRPLGIIEMEAGDSFDSEDSLGLGMVGIKDILLTSTGAGNFVMSINGLDYTLGVNAVRLTVRFPYNRQLRTANITSAPANGMVYMMMERRPVSVGG